MKELTLQQLASWCGGKVAPEYEAIKVNGIQSDSRKVQPGELFLALHGERVDGHDYIPAAKGKGAVAALVSQESGELPCIVVENTLRAYGEIARHYREMLSFKVVGITGSVGKTTTKEMIASVLSRDFKLYKSEGNHNNEIGLPMTVMNMPEDTELLVAELGTNHPGEIAYLSAIAQPDYAVITNIGIAHIEYLGSREGILREKLDILRSSLKNTVGIFNGDEPLLWNVRDKGTHKKYYFGIDNPSCDVVASGIQELDDGMRFHVSGFHHEFELFVPALGRHMVYNALAAGLKSVGDSKTPLKFLAFSAVLNAVLDLILIGGLGFGIVCSAVTTVVAEAASALLAAVYMARRVPELCPGQGQWRIRRDLLGPILRYGAVTAVQQAVQPICKVLIQGQVNALGVGAIAAFNAVTRVDDFAFTPEQSIATAITTYIAQNRGAGQTARIRRGFAVGLRLELGYWLLMGSLTLLLRRGILSLFVAGEGAADVIALGSTYLGCMAAFYALPALTNGFQGFYRGMGKMTTTLIGTCLQAGLRAAAAAVLAPRVGLPGIAFACAFGWCVMLAFEVPYYFWTCREL